MLLRRRAHRQARPSQDLRLWQRYGFEHTLRDDELTLVVVKYILENPVRAGLVKRVEDYQFGGSLVYALSELLESIATRSG